MKWLDEKLYPQLRALPEDQREAALRNARSAPFDVVELVGMAAGLIVVTAATRYTAVGWSSLEQVTRAAMTFIVALPLLIIAVGPFMVRRTRRNLSDREGASR